MPNPERGRGPYYLRRAPPPPLLLGAYAPRNGSRLSRAYLEENVADPVLAMTAPCSGLVNRDVSTSPSACWSSAGTTPVESHDERGAPPHPVAARSDLHHRRHGHRIGDLSHAGRGGPRRRFGRHGARRMDRRRRAVAARRAHVCGARGGEP